MEVEDRKVVDSADEIYELRRIISVQEEEIAQLKSVIKDVPGDVYWKDRTGLWLGLNQTASESLKKMGFLGQVLNLL